MVAFLVLIFWGVLGQAAAGNAGEAVATERFFGSYFLWVLGVIPLPAFKTLALVASLHLIASMVYRMPKVRGVPQGWRNLGLYGMHVALLVLLVGSLVGAELRAEYQGFRAEPTSSSVTANPKISYFAMDDSLNTQVVEIPEGYPYFVFYRGQVDMFGVNVEMYTATYDPLKFVPYVFMALFLFSALFHYAARGRRSSKMLAESGLPLTKTLPALLFGLLGLFAAAPTHAGEIFYIPDSIPCVGTELVKVGDGVRPFDSFARGVLDQFSGKVTYKDSQGYTLQASSVVCDIMLTNVFNTWVENYRIFKVLRNDVLTALNLPEKERYFSYSQLQKSRDLLDLYASRKDNHPATLEMRRIQDNILLYESLARRDFPKKANQEEGVRVKPKTEVFYNHANFALMAFILAFVGCIVAAVNSVFKKRSLDIGANVMSGVTAAVLVVAFALRFYIAARPPLSSLYEIVLLVALLLEAFEFGAFLFCKKRTFTLMIPVTVMAAVLLFFAKFVLEPGDLFQPIPAVLNSSIFLTLHVFTIALGYAGVILSGVVAHVVLFRMKRNVPMDSLKPTCKLLAGTLVFGSLFTMVGTLLGGVWADFAWGRFWGFDPKECGALFVILWTMLGLHLRAAKVVSSHGFAFFNAFNVIVTFLCWFGINLLGVGLHSYGFQNGTATWLGCFVVADLLAIGVLSKEALK